ncbi:ABC transporter ATP-binding protein [Bacteriovoracaceae bacterium]|nr:ABC transporter ATP-binding protein [Bacteriovoracaceae bacterium]
MEEEAGIYIKNLKKFYPGVRALNEISFKISKGSIHGLLGPNGAGKSTTMRILAGLIRSNLGTITFENGSESRSLEKSEIGILPESPPLYRDMVVCDYLKFVGRINGVMKRDIQSSIDWVVDKVGIGEVSNRIIGNLSKGMRQRVGIAGAIIHKPALIILDEPTSGLDPESIAKIRDLIKSLKGEHTIILSTHLLNEVKILCEEMTILHEGNVLFSGHMSDLEDRFYRNRKIQAVVSKWNESDRAYFSALVGILEIQHTNRDDQTDEVIFVLSDNGYTSNELLEELGVRRCFPTNFNEVHADVEEIYLELMKERRES